MVDALSALLFLICMVAAVPGIAVLILGPVSLAAGRLNAPTRFQLSDFLWLFVLLQAALGVSVQGIGLDLPELFTPVLTFLVCASLALWAGAISFLSRARVTSTVRRGCFIILQLPLTLGMMIWWPGAVFFSVQTAAIYLYEVGIERREFDALMVAGATLVGVAGVAVAALLCWALRMLSLWIVADHAKAGSTA